MLDIKQAQKRIYANKVSKNFNVSDIYKEFCYLHGELTEACDAYMHKKGNVGEELADIAIYLLGIAEILGVNLEQEILIKMDKNEKRKFMQKDGVHIRISEGDGTYACDYGFAHDYSRFNLEEHEKELETVKAYTNLDEMWADMDSEYDEHNDDDEI